MLFSYCQEVIFIFSKENFAGRLKKLRLLKGLTQSELGEVVGLKKQAINDIEHARATTVTEKLVTLARYFGVSIDYLVVESDDPTRR